MLLRQEQRLPMSAAAMPYCSACMLRLTGLRSQERAKRAQRMPVWRRCDAPFPLQSTPSNLPDLSDRLSQKTAQAQSMSRPSLELSQTLPDHMLFGASAHSSA